MPIPGDRTLDFFIAHEVTHQPTGRELGPLRSFILPQYVRERFADYIGKGDALDYEQARRDFLAGRPQMDYKKSRLYLRFNLLVAYLLEHRGWSVDKLLKDRHPNRTWKQPSGRSSPGSR